MNDSITNITEVFYNNIGVINSGLAVDHLPKI